MAKRNGRSVALPVRIGDRIGVVVPINSVVRTPEQTEIAVTPAHPDIQQRRMAV
jgi:hypothetical protein